MELRLRSRISEAELDEKKGKILTTEDVNLVATGACKVLKPDGSLLFIYLPGAIGKALRSRVRPTLSELKAYKTSNRGLASGTKRVNHRDGFKAAASGNRTATKPIASAIIGAFDPQGPKQYCRLTAYTAREADKYEGLFPLFQRVAALMREHTPERWRAQQDFADRTQPEWVIPGTPFTTITVNNSYPTGVHTDKGDLDQGISTIVCFRQGELDGGWLCFPRYRIGVDLQDGDLILMDAHEWHGNTPLELLSDDAERISVVCYYRTRMAECGSLTEEEQRRLELNEKRAIAVGE